MPGDFDDRRLNGATVEVNVRVDPLASSRMLTDHIYIRAYVLACDAIMFHAEECVCECVCEMRMCDERIESKVT